MQQTELLDMSTFLNIVLMHANNSYIREDKYVVENASDCTLDLLSLENHVKNNNLNWEIHDSQIQDNRKCIYFVKKCVRKFTRWYISLYFQKQSAFNRSTTLSINEVLNRFYHTQCIIDLLTQTIQKQKNELLALKNRVETLETILDEQKYRDQSNLNF